MPTLRRASSRVEFFLNFLLLGLSYSNLCLPPANVFNGHLLETSCFRVKKLIFSKLRQLTGSEHYLAANQERRVHFGVTVLVGMQVEHELRQSAFESRESALQDNEA